MIRPPAVDENARGNLPKDAHQAQATATPAGAEQRPDDPTLRVTPTTGDPQTRSDTRDPGTPKTMQQVLDRLDQLGLRRGPDGKLVRNDRAVTGPEAAVPTQPANGRAAILDALPALPSPPLANGEAKPQALESFAAALGRSLDDVFAPTTPGGVPSLMDTLAADSLTAAFLKVNIENPFDTVENRNKINQLASDMRQALIKNIQKELESLWERLQEVMASMRGAFFLAAIIAAIVAAIIASILVAIIMAVVMMVVMMAVKAAVHKKVEAAKTMAMEEAERARIQGEAQIEAERQRQLEELANMSLVDQNGDPITDERLRRRLQPRLVEALTQVAAILDAEGPEAAAAAGPQIVHDAMLDELLALGIQVPEGADFTEEEMADQLAWAIALESMKGFEEKVGREPVVTTPPEPVEEPDTGRDPGQIVPVEPGTPPVVPSEPEVEPDTGRHPGDLLSSFAGLSADELLQLAELADSPLVEQANRLITESTPKDELQRIEESLFTKGIEATLREELLREPSIVPATTLAFTAVVHGALPADHADDVLSGRVSLDQLAELLSAGKDQALESLVDVTEESAQATQRLQHMTHV